MIWSEEQVEQEYNMHTVDILYQKAIGWLCSLVSIPSFSKEEERTADLLSAVLKEEGISFRRVGNNLIACNTKAGSSKPSLLLNSHHDTVRPNKGYTIDPFLPLLKDGKLYGLGSNDAGGCLVSLLSTFLYFNDRSDLPYNIWFVASAEEEISGRNGIETTLPHVGKMAVAIVGEPTRMEMAVAERGLLVVDCIAEGKAGHAARGEGENALYQALDDIQRLRELTFDNTSPLLGPNRITATVIETPNQQHNVVPSECRFVLDIRLNDHTSFEDMLGLLSKNMKSRFQPRSTRMRSSSISLEHPLIKAGLSLGRSYYGSPTTSDVALLPFPALKMGPGDSARSHTADEFIYLHELKEGISGYIELLESFFQQSTPDQSPITT